MNPSNEPKSVTEAFTRNLERLYLADCKALADRLGTIVAIRDMAVAEKARYTGVHVFYPVSGENQTHIFNRLLLQGIRAKHLPASAESENSYAW